MKAMHVFFALLVAVWTAGSQASEDADTQAVVQANTAFALDLYGKLKDAEGNLFFSPYSISAALAMTYAGARNETAKQMGAVLHFPPQAPPHQALAALQRELNTPQDAYELSVANALWGQQGFEFQPAFVELLESDYGAGLNQVDFAGASEAARATINTWVEQQTGGKIKDLIKPGMLDNLTRLVLTNAVYFKGSWLDAFTEEQTRPAPFHTADGGEVEVAMMFREGDYRYRETDEVQALELPYQGEAMAMVILLPKRPEGLPALEAALVPEVLQTWLPDEDTAPLEVSVYLPKFKLEAEFALAEALKALGMTAAFAAPPADFSGITEQEELFLSAVVHKAFVAVDEQGTEAAAATGVTVKATSLAPPPPEFRADRPFIFLIRDRRSDSLLFMGRVLAPEPLASSSGADAAH